MRKVLAAKAGAILSGAMLAMLLTGLPAQAACNDYGQPPCPVPTVTPQPPAPSPSPTQTPTPTPTLTPEPVETTNPQHAEVIGEGAIIVLSQAEAESAPPRLVLHPLAGQTVLMTRLEAEQIIVQFLRPRVKYLSQIFAHGKWFTIGTTTANAKGQLVLPAIRGIELGFYPIRLIPSVTSGSVEKGTKFFKLGIVKDKVAAAAAL
ncbi:MAG: hypothetical protein Q7L55_04815 [Actinomycetota bacterium]|nr:hypothetical protein [Actinomycetota bacterium]